MKIHIYFDYTCPFCYIGERQLAAVLEFFPEIDPAWHPFELRPRPTDRPEITADPDTGEAWEPALVAEAENEGLRLHAPFSPLPYSDRAFQVMHYVASIGGDVRAYNERVFRAVFEDGRNIGDPAVLADIAQGLRFDPQAVGRLLNEGLYVEAQQKALRHAYFESGVEELPTFKFMGLRVSGAVGREVMRKFIGDGLRAKEKAERNKAEAEAENAPEPVE